MLEHLERENGAVAHAARLLATHFGTSTAPATAVVLGSGLGAVADAVVDGRTGSQAACGLPVPRVGGHGGTLTVGRLGDADVAVLVGRVHAYEGHTPLTVVRAVRALHAWGVRRLVLTNAAGSVRAALPPGRLVRIVDHLNLTGDSSLVGRWYGDGFPDGAHTWDAALGDRLDAAAAAEGVPWSRGVYAGMLGPAYETPAEVRMLAGLGADVVGMSTVHEALAGHALGMAVAGVSVVTNYGAGVGTGDVDHDAVTDVAGHAADAMVRVLSSAL